MCMEEEGGKWWWEKTFWNVKYAERSSYAIFFLVLVNFFKLSKKSYGIALSCVIKKLTKYDSKNFQLDTNLFLTPDIHTFMNV